MVTREQVPPKVIELSDRRREPRASQSDSVRVSVGQAGAPVEFQAVLVNASSGGLAIRHLYRDLIAGQEVHVASPSQGEFTADVMWNWSVGPLVISGLKKARTNPVVNIGTRRPIDSATKAHSWMWAAMAGLIAIVCWYLANKGW